jgi:hypothetical protein
MLCCAIMTAIQIQLQAMMTRSLTRQRQHYVVCIQHVARGSLSTSPLPSSQVSPPAYMACLCRDAQQGLLGNS